MQKATTQSHNRLSSLSKQLTMYRCIRLIMIYLMMDNVSSEDEMVVHMTDKHQLQEALSQNDTVLFVGM